MQHRNYVHLDTRIGLRSFSPLLSVDSLGVVANLEEAVALGHAALELRTPWHQTVAKLSTISLVTSIAGSKDKVAMNDLAEAVELHRTALQLRPSGH